MLWRCLVLAPLACNVGLHHPVSTVPRELTCLSPSGIMWLPSSLSLDYEQLSGGGDEGTDPRSHLMSAIALGSNGLRKVSAAPAMTSA